MDKSKFEACIFSSYAFICWVWTIAIHGQEILPPGTRSTVGVCPLEFAWLGDTPLGWRFDVALRKGWTMLDDDARAFAVEHLIPLCSEGQVDMLYGRLRAAVSRLHAAAPTEGDG